MGEKLTEWVSGDVMPVRRGVYQVHNGMSVYYSLWNGRFWCASEMTPKLASFNEAIPSSAPIKKWRGLAGKP